jgi:hypothetical protein
LFTLIAGLPARRYWTTSGWMRPKEKSRLAAGPFCESLNSELPVAVALLVRGLALAVRILLLLAGLLAAALLLTGTLAGVLVLLARLLILVRHRFLPWLNLARVNSRLWSSFHEKSGSGLVIERRRLVAIVAAGTLRPN